MPFLTQLYLFVHTFICSTFILTQEHNDKRRCAQSRQEIKCSSTQETPTLSMKMMAGKKILWCFLTHLEGNRVKRGAEQSCFLGPQAESEGPPRVLNAKGPESTTEPGHRLPSEPHVCIFVQIYTMYLCCLRSPSYWNTGHLHDMIKFYFMLQSRFCSY